MEIVLLGTGNTATILGRLFTDAGHRIAQVYGRTPRNADDLAAQLNTVAISDPAQLNSNADVYIIAISDNGIENLVPLFHWNNRTVLHTAGSVSMNVLKPYTKNYGIIYPLQSLRKENTTPQVIPLLVDANTNENLTLITDLANSISSHVQRATDQERSQYHLAAVFANNFANHFFTLVQDYCTKMGLDFAFVLPVIQQLTEKLISIPASQLQTGPAIRNDSQTIARHLEMLQQHPPMADLYKMITESIQQHYRL
ncbi:MAG: DUF2520 domain-containing protein [Chitinophagaceae bacterium]|nr:DUF2520 domain-containing protein [Chitinophagaceae bacterium]